MFHVEPLFRVISAELFRLRFRSLGHHETLTRGTRSVQEP